MVRKFLVTRASEDYWYKIEKFSSLEQLLNFARKKGSIIIEKNNWTEYELSFWDGVRPQDVPVIANECDYQITIYDDYIE